MNIIYLRLVVLFTFEVRNVVSPGSPSQAQAQAPVRQISFQPPPASGITLCSSANIGTQACHLECLAIQRAIYAFYVKYPKHGAIGYLYGKCGYVTAGSCMPLISGNFPIFPVCTCHTPDGYGGWRSNYLYTCRKLIPIVRSIANAILKFKNRQSGAGSGNTSGGKQDQIISKVKPFVKDAMKHKKGHKRSGKKEGEEEEEGEGSSSSSESDNEGKQQALAPAESNRFQSTGGDEGIFGGGGGSFSLGGSSGGFSLFD